MAFAQPPPPWPPPPPDAGYPTESPPPPAPDAGSATLPPLDQLLAPIALYPDPLISLILPASTFPDQVQDAAAFAQSGGDPSQVGSMGWDSSVQGLAHYPSVAEWMGANFTWTQQLGGAFANQPAAVMDAIQDLRRRAQAAGTLVTNAQQQVVVYGDSLEIMPQQPEVIYVPQYDPAVVYVEQPYGYYPGPLFAWSQPYPAGAWLSFDFDWQRHAVWQGDWYQYRMQHGGWGRPVNFAQFNVSVNVNGGSQVRMNNFGYSGWHPPHNAPPPPPQLTARWSGSSSSLTVQANFAQPRVMSGTPRPPAGALRVTSLVVTRGERPPSAQAGPSNGYRPDFNPQATQAPRQVQAQTYAQSNGGRNPENRPDFEAGHPQPNHPPGTAPKKPVPKSKEEQDKDKKDQNPQRQ